ncbi:MAG: sugar phosphate nucleotidyltransferase [bacterium]|nr:sugar phosphate nucleotidyltransferase [bacterium]
MKTIILCGGMGYRLREETEFKPKPMILIGDKPILWHIMKIYNHYGHNEFVFTLGYKGHMVKDYFINHKFFTHDITHDTRNGMTHYHNNNSEDFVITFAETGEESMTGKRILLAKQYITEDEFMLTYGDGVADINIDELIKFHRQQKKFGTITGVHPYSKYGLVSVDEDKNLVKSFRQKPLMSEYVSGGFMVFNKKAFKYFDEGPMENGLKRLAAKGQLSFFKHQGFWKSMDTYQEMLELNKLWDKKKPWLIWKDKKNEKFTKLL